MGGAAGAARLQGGSRAEGGGEVVVDHWWLELREAGGGHLGDRRRRRRCQRKVPAFSPENYRRKVPVLKSGGDGQLQRAAVRVKRKVAVAGRVG